MAPLLREGSEKITRLSESVAGSGRETKAVIGLIGSLEIAARQIEKIVDRIALVAVQTNMLAGHGSIEAARAGEAGRGFAVVSSDIRNLARDSTDNAGRMQDVVRQIQTQIAAVRSDLEQIAGMAEADAGRNRVIIERLDGVQADMVALRAGAAETLAGSEFRPCRGPRRSHRQPADRRGRGRSQRRRRARPPAPPDSRLVAHRILQPQSKRLPAWPTNWQLRKPEAVASAGRPPR